MVEIDTFPLTCIDDNLLFVIWRFAFKNFCAGLRVVWALSPLMLYLVFAWIASAFALSMLEGIADVLALRFVLDEVVAWV